MSVELREVKRRISSTRQIRKVTTALRNVASARMTRDRSAVGRAGQYVRALGDVLGTLVQTVDEPEHPFLVPRDGGDTALFVFGSDRGLCGGFNTGLMGELEVFLAGHDRSRVRFLVMGQVIRRRMRHRGLDVEHFCSQPAAAAARAAGERGAIPDEVLEMAARAARGYRAGRFREVYMLYSRFENALRQEAVVERLLPLGFTDQPAGQALLTICEPRPEALLDELLPELLERRVEMAFLNSTASENAERQSAMSRASENAQDIIRDLSGTYRRLRQESITTEVLELVGGKLS